MQLREIITASKTCEILGGMTLKPKLGYWVGKLANKLESDVKAYTKAREDLTKKYSELDKAGRPKTEKQGEGKNQVEVIKFKSDKDEEKFKEDNSTLLDVETKLDFQKIKLSLFLQEEEKIPALVYQNLFSFIEDDEEAWEKEQAKKDKSEK